MLARLNFSNPWNSGARPYLVLSLVGPSGTPQLALGLIDTGADASSLPIGYASLLGYDASTLTKIKLLIANGALVDAFQPNVACAATVVGTPVTLPLRPTFVIGAGAQNVLWGRQDVMAAFEAVAFRERESAFILEWDDSLYPAASA